MPFSPRPMLHIQMHSLSLSCEPSRAQPCTDERPSCTQPIPRAPKNWALSLPIALSRWSPGPLIPLFAHPLRLLSLHRASDATWSARLSSIHVSVGDRLASPHTARAARPSFCWPWVRPTPPPFSSGGFAIHLTDVAWVSVVVQQSACSPWVPLPQDRFPVRIRRLCGTEALVNALLSAFRPQVPAGGGGGGL